MQVALLGTLADAGSLDIQDQVHVAVAPAVSVPLPVSYAGDQTPCAARRCQAVQAVLLRQAAALW